ncbi:MAG: hypothetical protein GYA24_17730 [Candidatus Lokiarchaeota archaeon]|nr:hypothetical protein [Candidatus Lokiarchaeota archaeon]
MSSYNRKKAPEAGKKDYLVSLALEQNAQVGKEFIHDEIPGACKECRLYQICMKNLEKGRVYIIKEVNDSTRHECPKKLFPGQMVVVKVKEKPLLVSFPSSKTFEGMRLTYTGQNCPEKLCRYHSCCDPPENTLAKGSQVKCVKILRKIRPECKLNRDLSVMEVARDIPWS